ncbi:TetR/AcrR family transcriptional regulator [Myceligenerans pegani]|uniref:TetR family transcriptional regulator C-terminal domain-containing protein n=1 Tax=Myceligenerans pegani TaxID=2776917 RepID=A0ABR9MXU7_9MICO|nr:TetR family transcriptional regulator C-terminal domain-containing protein [Myceligenerans sp. TRM 65318]MBE1875876.1 TetR family transcriptional regulator C-terminal domain-containing protein [Myceligenerans sp. TRM 65318]MBE3018147.1 TetR family transcriptional regulator C-terminal domain-containing protein [Myceligenerans sp. TRM 65318]
MPKIVDPEQRRAAIADAVVGEIVEHGIRAVTLARVAARSGLAIGSVRHYVANFDELLELSLALVQERGAERVRASGVLDETDPAARLAGFVEVLAPTTEEDHRANIVFLEYLALARTEPRLAEYIEAAQVQARKQVGDMLREMLGDAATDDDIRLETMQLMALSDGLALAAEHAGGPYSPDDIHALALRHVERVRAAYPPTSAANIDARP